MTPELLADLALRALLTDAAGIISFPANVIQEARAGRALLKAGDEGLALLESTAFVTLPVADRVGARVRAVRRSWMNTLELLLPDAPQLWRDRVATFDPMLAARATPSTAPKNVRHRALRTLWNTYRERHVWLDRGRSGEERDDGGALIRLVTAGAPEGFVDELREALTSPEPTMRANALTVIPAVADPTELIGYVHRAITDTDPVVRRQAALAAWQNPFAELGPYIADQAISDTDELAAQTLLEIAIALAPGDEATQLAERAPSRLQERAWRELTRHLPRSALGRVLRIFGARCVKHGSCMIDMI